jgi:hypothetical protein
MRSGNRLNQICDAGGCPEFVIRGNVYYFSWNSTWKATEVQFEVGYRSTYYLKSPPRALCA